MPASFGDARQFRSTSGSPGRKTAVIARRNCKHGPELKDLAEALLRDDFFGARGISGPGADSSQYYLNPLCPLIVLGLGFLLIFHVSWLNAGRHRRDLTIWGGLLSWLKK
jgi:hypothetical protein